MGLRRGRTFGLYSLDPPARQFAATGRRHSLSPAAVLRGRGGVSKGGIAECYMVICDVWGGQAGVNLGRAGMVSERPAGEDCRAGPGRDLTILNHGRRDG